MNASEASAPARPTTPFAASRRRVLALVWKDWRDLARNRQALAPLVVVPLVFVVLLPAAVPTGLNAAQGAQGVAVLVVLPVIALVVGQATGMMLFDAGIALAAASVLLVVDLAVLPLVARGVDRERILTRLT